jgi:hypothetical protein
MKEKIKEILNKILEKLPFKEKIEKKVKEFGEKPRKKKKSKYKKKSQLQKKLEKIFSYRTLVPVFGGIVSILGILFFVYTVYDYYHSKSVKHDARNSIIRANLLYGTRYMLRKAENEKLRGKSVRRYIKELNGIDQFGRQHKFSPCDSSVTAFGETAKPGNVTLYMPNNYYLKLTAYSCSVERISSYSIKLKRPEKKKNTKAKKPEDKNRPPVKIPEEHSRQNAQPEEGQKTQKKQ